MGIFPIRKEDQDLISLTGSGLLNQAAITRSQQAAGAEAALDMLRQSIPQTQTTPIIEDVSSAVVTRPENVDTTTLDPVPTNNPFEDSLGNPIRGGSLGSRIRPAEPERTGVGSLGSIIRKAIARREVQPTESIPSAPTFRLDDPAPIKNISDVFRIAGISDQGIGSIGMDQSY